MKKILTPKFFNRDTKKVAEELLGKFLVRKIAGKEISMMVAETEAYDGFYDLASHASKGKTQRTQIMFSNPGKFYVYLCYGMHHMLNVVAREKGYPAAVLIRKVGSINGPGKLTKLFKINQEFNGKMASPSSHLWFEDRGVTVPKSQIKKMKRVGVEYAGPVWSAKKWRFLVKSKEIDKGFDS